MGGRLRGHWRREERKSLILGAGRLEERKKYEKNSRGGSAEEKKPGIGGNGKEVRASARLGANGLKG